LTALKITPYYVHKQKAFSVAALGEITTMPYADESERRDLVVMNFTCYSGIRIEDIHNTKTRHFTKHQADQDNPRHLAALLEQTKNDKDGTGPASGRTFVIPCICMPSLLPDKKKWCKTLLENPNAPCLEGCPYNIINSYIEDCPRPLKDTADELAFIRALSSRGDENRTIARGPLGYNEIMKIPQRVNLMLSESNQVSKATGKAGRMSFTSIAMNKTKVGAEVVALATKHRDPKTMVGYIEPDRGLLMKAALGVGQAAKDCTLQNRLAGIELTPPPSATKNLKRKWEDDDSLKENDVNNTTILLPSLIRKSLDNVVNNNTAIQTTSSEVGGNNKSVSLTFNFQF
jgi:hypothetical protein